MQAEDTVRGLTLQECAKLCAKLSITGQSLSKPNEAFRRALQGGTRSYHVQRVSDIWT